MADPIPVRIALGAVVLDTPDRSGQFFASDAVGGWSYLITDQAGDYRYRGDGSCPGGLDTAMRWALLAALDQVRDFSRIQLLFPSRQTHAVAERLSQRDDLVQAAMAGRVVGLLIRPDDRSVTRAAMAAEQAAANLLRDRARGEKVEDAGLPRQPSRAWVDRPAVAPRAPEPIGMGAWRAARIERPAPPPLRRTAAPEPAAAASPSARTVPLMDGLLARLSGMGVPGLRRRPSGNPAIASWMSDFDSQVAAVQSHLEGVGA
jgi:hypothetical protein